MGNNLVSWISKKQNSISLSTVEAEYITPSSCCTQLLWMQKLPHDYGICKEHLNILPNILPVAEPMMYLHLHVICSCIFMYTYLHFLIFLYTLCWYFSDCIYVSLSLSLSLSCVSLLLWHLNANLLCPRTLCVLGNILPLTLHHLLFSSMMRMLEKTSQRIFVDEAFIWNSSSFCQTFLTLTYLLSFTVGVGSHFVTSRSLVPP